FGKRANRQGAKSAKAGQENRKSELREHPGPGGGLRCVLSLLYPSPALALLAPWRFVLVEEQTMRFPLSLTTSMVGYIARKKLAGVRRSPLVLMLEPLHACNLTCTGCGRIREYSQTIKEKLTVRQCLEAVDEAGAPIVSICGGEPMIYPQIG